MGERLRLGLKLRNKREIGAGPRKGKNQGERLELSQTHGRSKHAGSHRARREPQAEGEAHPEGYRAKHKRQPADGSKCNAGGLVSVTSAREEQWRSKNSRRLAASARTTQKGSVVSCRALRGASERGTNQIRKDLG